MNKKRVHFTYGFVFRCLLTGMVGVSPSIGFKFAGRNGLMVMFSGGEGSPMFDEPVVVVGTIGVPGNTLEAGVSRTKKDGGQGMGKLMCRSIPTEIERIKRQF